MRPDDFWNGTLDEAILTYKGKVDEWRFFRSGFNLVHCSLVGKDRVNMLEALPLPFDVELEGKADLDEMIEEYYKLQKAGVFDA